MKGGLRLPLQEKEKKYSTGLHLVLAVEVTRSVYYGANHFKKYHKFYLFYFIFYMQTLL